MSLSRIRLIARLWWRYWQEPGHWFKQDYNQPLFPPGKMLRGWMPLPAPAAAQNEEGPTNG
jgi:hypothetical protein